jgi:hypothetical protein
MFKKYYPVVLFFLVSFITFQSKSDFSLQNIFSSKAGVKAVSSSIYQEECGSCHFAYQPGLLPSRSWIKLMSDNELSNHFKEDIAFDDQKIVKELTDYLIENSTDNSSYKRSIKINRSIKFNETPLRVSKTPYIKRKHHNISKEILSQEAVGSLSNCTACHNNAEHGDFNEDSVTIPSISAGHIMDELNSKSDGYKGDIELSGQSYRIISTKVKGSGQFKKLCRVVSFKTLDNFKVQTFCKYKEGSWF